jgi:mono/diheme cytochrome c family protein
MNRIALAVLATAFGWLAAAPSFAADDAVIAAGNRAFQYNCAPCHGPGPGERARFLPGTVALTVKYKGQKPGVLEQRDDLTPEFVAYIIRHGIEGMPFFRKTEVSDASMAAIGAYLAKAKK